MEDLSRFCCQNSKCPDYGKRGGGNLSVCDHYGPGKQRRMLRCASCKTRFSERKGTVLFGATLPEEKILSVLEHIDEGCGVRETGRLVGVHRDTVIRYSRLAGNHAQQVHDELLDFSPQHAGGAVRREVVVRGKKGKALRSGRPRRRQAGR
jgi:LacI family transcriptional regulator